MKRLWLLFSFAVVLLGTAPLPTTLEVKLLGLRNERGTARVAVFATRAGWPQQDGKAYRRAIATIDRGRASVSFEGLPPGAYAVIAFHDEDGDERLKTGLFGVPVEGWGASNDARATFGPAFDDALVKVDAPKAISFSIRY